MPVVPHFPEPGSYVRYFDVKAKGYKYLRLMWRRMPYIYPYRFPSASSGALGTEKVFDELNPAEDKAHRYLVYLGVSPGFLYRLFHPYDIRNLKWDEDVIDISEDMTGVIRYEESPYENPVKSFALEYNRYPSILPLNISGASRVAEVIFIGALYVVKEHRELSGEEIAALESGKQKSYPWDFGGEL